MTNAFIKSCTLQFEYYKSLGDKTLERLTEEQLFFQYNPESNSIAAIVKHLSGNMISRWQNFLTTDGEKEWRNREGEFEEPLLNKTEILQKWEEGWNCLFAALKSITEENFDTIIYIRNQGHTIMEALHRQLAHYPYHIGQMVYIGKMIIDKDWASLSIPRGNSQSYNAEKFAQPKRKEHFVEAMQKKNKKK